jgi:S-methylmethionine-dependent homocysteine/selenocysteine methylase
MDATSFRRALDSGEVIVLDGGLATQLEAQGADLSDALWSARLLVEDPDAIVDAHLAYFRAGGRVATTASYQATFEGFAARGIGRQDGEDLLRRSVELAAVARSRVEAERDDGVARFVAASIGPYGAMLADGSEYRGRYGLTIDELRAFHRDRLGVLAATHADVLAAETVPEVEEAIAVASLVAETEGAAAWISFSCADGARIRSGAPIEEAVHAVSGAPGIVAVGINCTAPEHVEELIGRVAAATDLPIVAYPNSGEGWDAGRRAWAGRAGARVDGPAAAGWVHLGARLVGGCCRVTPAQIESIATAVG